MEEELNERIEKLEKRIMYLENERAPDNLEFGKTGKRFKIKYDASNPKQMVEKLENQMGLVALAESLAEEEAVKDGLVEDLLKKAKGY